MDEFLHILDIAVFLLPYIVRFIISDPNGTRGKELDLRIVDVFINAFSEGFSFYSFRVFRMKMDCKVFYEKLECLSIANAGNLIERILFGSSSLIKDPNELWRKS